MTIKRVAFKRGKKQPWIKARSTGGLCTTVSWDILESMLRGCSNRVLTVEERVERFEVDDKGVTVFIGERK